MKKLYLLIGLFILLWSPALGAQSLGSGFSVFIPESVLHEEGSISVETNLSTRIGTGSFLSIPIGVTYIKANGLLPQLPDAQKPWIYSDNFIGFAGLQADVDIGPLEFSVGGGGAINWMPVYTPLESTIARHFSEGDNEITALAPGSLETELGLGTGWYLETGVGYTINPQISISLSGRFYSLSSAFSAQADAYRIPEGDPSQTIGPEAVATESDLRVRLRGASIGIGGSFRF